jgi:hypothetical protein
MKKLTYLSLTFILIQGCSTWKNAMIANGNYNDAIQNAVVDFLHSGSLRKQDSVFSVDVKRFGDTLLGVSIIGSEAKLCPNEKDKIGSNLTTFPNCFLDRNGKLFFWYDPAGKITVEFVKALSKYKQVDSTNVNGFVRYPDYGPNDDAKQSMHYYFCKCDLRRYKKIRSIVNMGYYKPPELKCSCK